MTLRAALLVGLLPAVTLAAGVPEPSGYRGEPYRAPVPATLAGAEVLDTGAAHALWAAGDAVFVDVMPRQARPEGLPEGTIWRDRPRDSIPGATWLPNTGYAELSDAEAAYFRDGLAAAAGPPPGEAVVFFCLAECWMSWNAARRAIEAGYERVSWYPDGTDGWRAAGHPLAPVDPSTAS